MLCGDIAGDARGPQGELLSSSRVCCVSSISGLLRGFLEALCGSSFTPAPGGWGLTHRELLVPFGRHWALSPLWLCPQVMGGSLL